MIFITFMGRGVRNTTVTRMVKTESLDCTSVPSAEFINGRIVNLYECPKNVPLKVWKRLHKQARMEIVWRGMSRNKRINTIVMMMADAFGAEKFKWYEI